MPVDNVKVELIYLFIIIRYFDYNVWIEKIKYSESTELVKFKVSQIYQHFPWRKDDKICNSWI